MKRAFLLPAICFISIAAFSQDFSAIIKDGDKAMNKGEYLEALRKYEAAEALEPARKNEVKIKKDALFNKIAAIGGSNSNAQRQIKKLLDTIQYQKEVVKAALTKAENLINAFYFYDGKLALAYKNGKFGFIDTTGKAIIPYRYETADQFDYTGFARVQDIQEFRVPNSFPQKTEYRPVDYLIDTYDTQYKVAYRLEDLVETENMIQQEKIEAVDLRNTPLLSFPPLINEYPDLKVLILDGKYNKQNNLKTITSSLSTFIKLQFLYLQYCKLDSLPEDIWKIEGLQSLGLRGNNLRSLPESIVQLTEIQKLNLIENGIGSLPDNFGQLKKLRVLLLTDNPLAALPESFSGLNSLRVLSLSKNSFSAWPGAVEKLDGLEHFNYSNNSLGYFPSQLLLLKNLETLDFSFNQVNQLPGGINRLVRLKNLNLRANELSGLPEGFAQLRNLESLDLSGNNITSFPMAILKLKNLNKLDLSFNRSLKSIPKEISNLKMLRELKLNNTSIPQHEQTKIRSWLPGCRIIFMQNERSD